MRTCHHRLEMEQDIKQPIMENNTNSSMVMNEKRQGLDLLAEAASDHADSGEVVVAVKKKRISRKANAPSLREKEVVRILILVMHYFDSYNIFGLRGINQICRSVQFINDKLNDRDLNIEISDPILKHYVPDFRTTFHVPRSDHCVKSRKNFILAVVDGAPTRFKSPAFARAVQLLREMIYPFTTKTATTTTTTTTETKTSETLVTDAEPEVVESDTDSTDTELVMTEGGSISTDHETGVFFDLAPQFKRTCPRARFTTGEFVRLVLLIVHYFDTHNVYGIGMSLLKISITDACVFITEKFNDQNLRFDDDEEIKRIIPDFQATFNIIRSVAAIRSQKDRILSFVLHGDQGKELKINSNPVISMALGLLRTKLEPGLVKRAVATIEKEPTNKRERSLEDETTQDERPTKKIETVDEDEKPVQKMEQPVDFLKVADMIFKYGTEEQKEECRATLMKKFKEQV